MAQATPLIHFHRQQLDVNLISAPSRRVLDVNRLARKKLTDAEKSINVSILLKKEGHIDKAQIECNKAVQYATRALLMNITDVNLKANLYLTYAIALTYQKKYQKALENCGLAISLKDVDPSVLDLIQGYMDIYLTHSCPGTPVIDCR